MYYNELKEKITAHAGKECADFAAKITTATATTVQLSIASTTGRATGAQFRRATK